MDRGGNLGFFRKLISSQQGQSSIMVGMMMLTFLFFFCFVVNVGMLVNAKINLQNAADLAAYAGAATQARQLNQVSYLNYEMRRQYKKFLFRYYVMGNMAQKQFPTQSAPNHGNTPYKWSPDGTDTVNFKVPVVCMIFKPEDNYCQLTALPPITIPPKGNFDAINDTLITELEKFERLRQDNCKAISDTNLMALRLWLYNTDPRLEQLKKQGFNLGNDPDSQKKAQNMQEALRVLTEIADGLGLIPRELILRRRIKTLEGYLNESGKTDLNLERAQNLKSSADPAKHERTIQAFLTAYYTLGNHIFSENLQFDELLPKDILKLKDVATRFDTYAIHFATDQASSSGKGNPCNAQVVNETVTSPITLGVAKDPAVLTYYAVRLKAKAKLLFSPWGEVQLTAYSAARPFGSRIGPDLQESDLVRENAQAAGKNSSGTASFDFAQKIPNLPITPDDTTTESGGWSTRETLGTLFRAAFPGNGTGAQARALNTSDIHRAYEIAMGPNPYEGALYNVPNDFQDPNDFAPNFDGSKLATLWAPVFPPDNPGSVTTELQADLEQIITAKTPDAIKLKESLKDGIMRYLDGLKSGAQNRENGETFNLVRLPDPSYFHPDDSKAGASKIADANLPDWILMKKPTDFLTSWNHPNDATARKSFPGQTGYSVKFIAFSTLLGTTPTEPKNSTTHTNGLKGIDEEADLDLAFIKH